MAESENRGQRIMPRRSGIRRCGALAAAALLTGLAACGGTDPDATNAEGEDAVTLELVGNVDVQAATEALIEAYRAENPAVSFSTSYAPVDQLQTSLRTQLGAGNAPDVFYAWPGNGSAMSTTQLAEAGLMEPLTGQEWVDRVPESLRQLLGHEGETYIWSPGVGPIGVIYNQSVFEEQGLEVPETWPEFLETCTALKEAGITPIALGAQTPWVTQLINYAIAPSVAFGDEPDLAQKMLEGEASFSDSGWRETFERYMQLDEMRCFNENPNGTTFEQAVSMIADGEAAMMVQVSAVYPQVVEASEGRAEYGMFPLPAADTAEALKIPAGVSAGYAVSPEGEHVDVAKDFLAFAGEEEQMKAFAATTGQIPFSVDDASSLDPLLQPFVPYIEADMTVPFMDQEWPNAEVQPVHFAVIQELFAGTTTIDGALAQLDEAYNQD